MAWVNKGEALRIAVLGDSEYALEVFHRIKTVYPATHRFIDASTFINDNRTVHVIITATHKSFYDNILLIKAHYAKARIFIAAENSEFLQPSELLAMRLAGIGNVDQIFEYIVKQRCQLKTLIVEDTDDHSKLVKTAIDNAFTMTVDIARDGNEAVKMWDQCDYDLVIMDMNLPKIHGLQLTTMFEEKRPWASIIAHSAHTNQESDMGTRFRKLGGLFVLDKPTIPRQFRDVLPACILRTIMLRKAYGRA